jgi:hypothetical protein
LIGRYQSAQAGPTSAVGIDHHQLRALAAGLDDKGPQVNVVAMNVRSPGDDVAREGELLWFGAQLHPEYGLQTHFPGDGADGAIQLRSAQAVEEATIHGAAVQHRQRAPAGVGKNGFAAEFAADFPEAICDLLERLVPGNALERLLRRDGGGRPRMPQPSEAPQLLARSLRGDPAHRIEHPFRRIHPVQILGHFGAKKPARHGMRRIPLNPSCAPILDCDQHSARVGTIVGTGGVNNFLHAE